MRIYKCSMGFRIPAVDQSHWSIEYNYDLTLYDSSFTGLPHFSFLICVQYNMRKRKSAMYYAERKLENKKGGGLGTRLPL